MVVEDTISCIIVFILTIGLGYIVYSLYKMKDYDKLSGHPEVLIGKRFEWRIHMDNPFEPDTVSIAEVIDLKERDGCGWVKYKCHDHDSIYTEPISSFADKYNKEV